MRARPWTHKEVRFLRDNTPDGPIRCANSDGSKEVDMSRRQRNSGHIGTMTFEDLDKRLTEILQLRGRPSDEDIAYTLEKLNKLRDDRMRDVFIQAIGWGDEERAELETFIAIALHVLKKTNPSKIREAARIVELRYLTRQG